jgi:YcxB-like protein
MRRLRRRWRCSLRTIEFEIFYGLREYLSVTREHVLPYVNEDRIKKGKSLVTANDWVLRITHAIFTTPIYLFKVISVGRCHFRIDNEQIERRSKDGVLKCDWKDVVEVKRYARAYLVMKTDGAMPLPYRCFTQEQRTEFDNLLSQLGK